MGLVLSKLREAQDICNAMRTCRAMAEAGRSRMVWRELSLRLEEEKTLDEMEARHGGAREAFKLLARDPVKRFRFIKRIPTLGLNASDDDLSPGERRAAVHGASHSFRPRRVRRKPIARAWRTTTPSASGSLCSLAWVGTRDFGCARTG